jgi:putative addiction module component (TIGR02574 family)
MPPETWSPAAAKLLADALELTVSEREEIALALLRSVDEEDDVSIAEIERRAQAVADGTATLIPWEEAMVSLRAELQAWREARGR